MNRQNITFAGYQTKTSLVKPLLTESI